MDNFRIVRNKGISISLHKAPLYFQIWTCVMAAVEWNKKEDLLQDQALRHLKQYVPLFAAFASTNRSELALLNKIQEYCYDNMNFLKTFNKIILLLYKSKYNFCFVVKVSFQPLIVLQLTFYQKRSS